MGFDIIEHQAQRKMEIRFIHRRDMDVRKWDEVIAESPAETLYPYSWYLDAVAANWSALVMDDYRFIMPLIWKRKYGLKYVYQPFYTQQLGVFSKERIEPAVIHSLLSELTAKFRFASIHFNVKNPVGEVNPFAVEDKTNYVLDLRSPYDELYTKFSTNTKRNIKRAHQIEENIDTGISCRELVDFKRTNDVIQRSGEQYSWLLNLLETIQKRGVGSIYGIRGSETLNAAAFFGFSQTRAIYLISASNEQGKDQRSMFKLINAFIHEHAGSELVLDFEGSNIPSVARFFAGFGARPETYQKVSFSRLPLFLNKLGKLG